MEYEGDKTIYDLSVNDKHSYITRSNFINSNTTSGRLSSRNPNGQNIPKVMVNPDIKKQFIPLIQSAIDKLDNRFTYIHKVYGKKHVWKFNKDFADYLDTIIPNKKLNMSLLSLIHI